MNPERVAVKGKSKQKTIRNPNDDIERKFDEIAKMSKDEQPSRTLRFKKRHRGRPRHGRVVFQQVRIDSLPRLGHLSEVARTLGIKHTTLQQWCELEKDPLPFVEEESGKKVFRKDVLVKWLIKTKRYSLKPEYANQEKTDEHASASK